MRNFTEMAQQHKFISKKELAGYYGVHPNTLNRELKLIPGLKHRKFQKFFNLVQQKIIFAHLGNPFS